MITTKNTPCSFKRNELPNLLSLYNYKNAIKFVYYFSDKPVKCPYHVNLSKYTFLRLRRIFVYVHIDVFSFSF